MATPSITASNASAPFNSLLLKDQNYIVSTSFGATAATASTTGVDFQVASPYPTTANVLALVQVANTSTSSGSVTVVLQESSDNSTWTPVANLVNPILTSTGSVATDSVTVGLQPSQKQYLRASAISSVGAVPTGSVTLSILM